MLWYIRVDVHTLIPLSLSLSPLTLSLSLIDIHSDVLQYLDDIKSGRIPAPPLPTSSTTTIKRAAATPAQKISSPPSTLTSTSSPSVPVIKMDSKTSPVLSYVDIPVDEVQRSRARQMVQSKATVPHVYASASCSVQRLRELAKGLGEDGSGI